MIAYTATDGLQAITRAYGLTFSPSADPSQTTARRLIWPGHWIAWLLGARRA